MSNNSITPLYSRVRSILFGVIHQVTGAWGVLAISPWLTVAVFDFLRLFGKTYSMSFYHHILTEIIYFPIQIIVAFVFGWLLSRYLKNRWGVWVWTIPGAILLLAFIFRPEVPFLYSSVLSSMGPFHTRVSHYFGHGCQPKYRCFDQLAITLPFYSGVAYSVGAYLSSKKWRNVSAQPKQAGAGLNKAVT